MAAEFKGLYLGLHLNGDELLKEFEAIDVKLRKTQSELNTLQRSLKIEFDGEKFKRAQELAQKAVQLSADKVNNLKKALEDADKQGVGKTTDGYKDLQKKLAEAELAAQKTNIKLKEINNIKIDKMSSQINSLNSSMDKIIGTSVKVATAFAAVGAGAVKLGLDAIERADAIATEADKLGLSAEALQRYNYLALQTDVSNESLSKSIVKINGDLGNLALGIQDDGNKALLSLIGSTKNADGTAKDAEQTFLEVITALSQMENQSVRTGLANKIFGERFAKDLNPMLNKAPEDIKKYLEEFEKIGYLSNDTVNDLALLDEKLNVTKQIFTQLGAEVGVQVTPFIEEFADFIQENKDEIGEWASSTMDNIIKVSKAIYDARGALVALVAIFALLKAALAVSSSILAYQKAMEGATGATARFNAIIASNPLGALAVVLGLVVGGIIAYKAATSDATDSTKKHSDELKKLSGSYNDLSASVNEKVTAQEGEIDNIERLYGELETLSKKENKSVEDKNRMKFAIDQINSVIPGAITLVNSETMAYQEQGGAIDTLIAKKRALIKLSGKEELYKQAVQNVEGLEYNAGNYLWEKQETDKKIKELESTPALSKEAAFEKGTELSKLYRDSKKYGELYNETQALGANYYGAITDYESSYETYLKEFGNPNKNKPGGGSGVGIPDYSKGGKGDNSADKAAREAEEQRKARVKSYEDTISEFERIDERYRKIKKEYGDLSVIDEFDSIKEQAQRYRKYADDVLSLDYLTSEEKTRLHKEYTEKAEDLELEQYKFAQSIRQKVIDDYEKKVEEAKNLAQEEHDHAQELIKEYLEARKDAISKALKEEQDAIQRSLDAELESISKRMAAQKELLQTKIDAINAEIQARRELREDEAAEEKILKIKKQIAATQAELSYTRDDDTLRELQKQLIRQQNELSKALQDKEDTLWYRSKNAEIDAIEAKIDALSDAEAEQIAIAKQNAQKAAARAASKAVAQKTAAEQAAYNSATTLYKNYYDTSNATYTYNQQQGTVVVQGGTISAAQIANVLNKITR